MYMIFNIGMECHLILYNNTQGEWIVTVLVYCDPPYLLYTRTSNRRYRFEYEEQDHIELLEIVKTLSCSVMLSGYPSTLYEDLLTGWRILELQVKKPVHINIDQTPVSGKLAEIKPVSIYQVRRTEKEILYNSLQTSVPNNF